MPYFMVLTRSTSYPNETINATLLLHHYAWKHRRQIPVFILLWPLQQSMCAWEVSMVEVSPQMKTALN